MHISKRQRTMYNKITLTMRITIACIKQTTNRKINPWKQKVQIVAHVFHTHFEILLKKKSHFLSHSGICLSQTDFIECLNISLFFPIGILHPTGREHRFTLPTNILTYFLKCSIVSCFDIKIDSRKLKEIVICWKNTSSTNKILTCLLNIYVSNNKAKFFTENKKRAVI